MRLSFAVTASLLCLFFAYDCASDGEAPVISITSPNNNDTITVHTSTINAQASDNKEVVYVEFHVNNVLIGTDSADPYETDWSIAAYDNMDVVSIQGTAYDAAENTGQSDVVLVTVVNRGMVGGAYTDTVLIYDGTWAVCDAAISDAPDSAVVDSIIVYTTVLHQQIADVDVYLQSPASTEYQLWDNNFNSPADTVSTALFAGENINGTWLLRIYDEVSNGLGGFATDFHIEIYWEY
jgi:subtilisin-like proprotein convertase family protein